MQQLAKLAALEATRKFVAKETQLERERFESEQKAKELQLGDGNSTCRISCV